MEYASALRTMSNSFAEADCMAAKAVMGETRAAEVRDADVKAAGAMIGETRADERKAADNTRAAEGMAAETTAAKADCCHKKEKPGTHKCNTTTDCCLSCPLCYVMLATEPAEHVAPASVSPDYAVWTSSYLYLHHGDCWKPPNAV